MPRVARFHKPGERHHVTNRTSRKLPAFIDGDDRRFFLWILSEFGRRFGIDVEAYCLMTNHYHLILGGTLAQLGAGMHRLGFLYTQYFNERHELDGPLFSDRYFSNPIHDKTYQRNAVRYVHRNPLAIDTEMDISRYPWSSHAIYLGRRSSSWVVTHPTLLLFGGSRQVFGGFVADPGNDVKRPELIDVHDVVCAVTGSSRPDVFRRNSSGVSDPLRLLCLLAAEPLSIHTHVIEEYTGVPASTIRNIIERARRIRDDDPNFRAMWAASIHKLGPVPDLPPWWDDSWGP